RGRWWRGPTARATARPCRLSVMPAGLLPAARPEIPGTPYVREPWLAGHRASPGADRAGGGGPTPLPGQTLAARTAHMPGLAARRCPHVLGKTVRTNEPCAAISGALAGCLLGQHVEETGKGEISMMTQAELEARLLAVETALKELQHRLATLPPAPHWLDTIIRSFKDEPAFEAGIAVGRPFRRAGPHSPDPG